MYTYTYRDQTDESVQQSSSTNTLATPKRKKTKKDSAMKKFFVKLTKVSSPQIFRLQFWWFSIFQEHSNLEIFRFQVHTYLSMQDA